MSQLKEPNVFITCVSVKHCDVNIASVRNWCWKNIGDGTIGKSKRKILWYNNYFPKDNTYRFYFKNKDDALVFHLMWKGEFCD